MPSNLIIALGQQQIFCGLSWAVVVWLLVSLIVLILHKRTYWGRYLTAIGLNEKAAFLSGLPHRMVVFLAFVFAGVCNALAGMMLAGYAGQAYMDMGVSYLLPAIAAVVIGGSNILGGKGTYLGALGGALLVTILSSLLAVAQWPESVRQITFGLIILAMVVAYSRHDPKNT